jgi:predicted transglutaminase-like cysteine proteinase
MPRVPGLVRLRLALPLFRIAYRYVDRDNDPWVTLAQDLPHEIFGPGSIQPFSWYFEGPSEVEVRNLDEVQSWLAGCQTVSDEELFRVEDYWQHPRTFEQLRRGDCEDHALWAWRKLTELGLDTEFVAGRARTTSTTDEFSGHAWLQIRLDEEITVFETVAKSTEPMLLPLETARQFYRPHVSINGKFQGRLYGGLPHTILEHKQNRGRKKGQGEQGVGNEGFSLG